MKIVCELLKYELYAGKKKKERLVAHFTQYNLF